jgi:hypothetical protein
MKKTLLIAVAVIFCTVVTSPVSYGSSALPQTQEMNGTNISVSVDQSGPGLVVTCTSSEDGWGTVTIQNLDDNSVITEEIEIVQGQGVTQAPKKRGRYIIHFHMNGVVADETFTVQ